MAQVRTSAGYAIGYAEAGSGEATPIIFLHGVGSDKSVWRPQLAHFSQNRRAIAFDYPGYGESDFVEGATRREFAEAILAAMDALGIEDAHVCGLSLGGIVAMELYGLAADRCRSLILADTFAQHPDGQGIYDRSTKAAAEIGMEMLAHQRAAALLAPTSAHLVPEVVATMARIDPAAYRLGAAAVWLAVERVRAMEIRTPALVLCGAEDRITPPDLSEELHELIPGSSLALIDRAGHLANLEQPEAFNQAIESFLAALG